MLVIHPRHDFSTPVTCQRRSIFLEKKQNLSWVQFTINTSSSRTTSAANNGNVTLYLINGRRQINYRCCFTAFKNNSISFLDLTVSCVILSYFIAFKQFKLLYTIVLYSSTKQLSV